MKSKKQIKESINELKIDLVDHKERLNELQDKSFIESMDKKFGKGVINPNYLIPVYKKIITSIKREVAKKEKQI